jgi:hypothetical protein
LNKVFSAALFIGAFLLFCATSSWSAEGTESAGAADPAEVTTDEQVEHALAQIAELRERVERLNLRAPEETGLTQRVAHRRLERTWGEIASSVRRLAADVATLQGDGVDRERFQGAVAALLPEIDDVRGLERPADPPTPTRAAAADEHGAQPADFPDAPGSEGNGEATFGEAPSSGSVG